MNTDAGAEGMRPKGIRHGGSCLEMAFLAHEGTKWFFGPGLECVTVAQFKISESRLRVIKDRQWPDRWGASYVAGLWADPKEAPGISTGSILRPTKVGLREFHTLSSAETFVALLCLHHPSVWDIHEQRIMYPLPRAHFLYGHPLASGISFQPFPGTIETAHRLQMKHPRVLLRVGNSPRDWQVAPFPYFSDLLLFMRDAEGVYVLNVSVKNKFADFRRRGIGKKLRSKDEADDPGTIQRQRLEESYYSSAGIRTQPIARDQLTDDLCWSLRDLFLDDSYVLEASVEQRADVVESLREGIGIDLPAHVLARKIALDCRLSMREVIAILKQSIWRRELRVDLFRPILMDKPLRPEVKDVFVHFAHWFAR